MSVLAQSGAKGADGGARPPQFLSTHPSHESRIRGLDGEIKLLPGKGANLARERRQKPGDPLPHGGRRVAQPVGIADVIAELREEQPGILVDAKMLHGRADDADFVEKQAVNGEQNHDHQQHPDHDLDQGKSGGADRAES